ncbi:hypothetical protein BD410DRAFT_728224 [Rickenella mellea]|uniref:GST N-terminal domain-containing protein n=1 Tax=Rickenella mellea TaxID=50990 RepID=A0A4Y7PTC9_9AGAM|nr:hypothetical protein BD410DRAFT_728224 [Rickenella mellea]
MTITLYDIPSTVPGSAFSPNVFKTRMALNFKGLSHKTEWVEYPDIAPRMKELGASPTGPPDDPEYTVPVIHDHSTGKIISNSLDIAQYLDETYPDTPQLLPSGPGIAAVFERYFIQSTTPLSRLMQPTQFPKLNPASHAFFRKSREDWTKCKVEDILPPGREREEAWSRVKQGMDKLYGLLEKNGKDKPFVFGDRITYAEFIMAGYLVWVKIMSEEEWVQISTWNGGRWDKLLEMTEKYRTIY